MGPTCRMAGCIRGANMKTIPAASYARCNVGTSTSMSTPSASSTSALPDREENERFPCFAMLTPAPAATIAAAVEMLNVGHRAAACTARIHDRVGARQRQPDHRAPKRRGDSGDDVRRLPPHSEPRQERRYLDRCRVAAHDYVERAGDCITRELRSVRERRYHSVKR